MCKYISFGKCNKNYYFILGSIAVKFIITFIYGYTPILEPDKTIYIFGFKSKIFSHPVITLCFQYLSMIIGGIILQIIYNHRNKGSRNIKEEEVVDVEKITDDLHTESIILREYKKNEKMKNKNDIKKIFLIFAVYFISQLTITSLNQLKLNRIKFWSLEPIFLYIFSKKVLNRTIYKHQKISIIIIIICCTSIYLVNSFLPYTKQCTYYNEKKNIKECAEICKELEQNVYEYIIHKYALFFIPIFIILYLAAMVGNSYSTVSIKWLMDIKYIRLFKILLNVGIIGFVFALIELFIFSFIPCPKKENQDSVKKICTFSYEGRDFYDNIISLFKLKADKYLYIDIFIIIPLFLISSFLDRFFELLIIENLDPFYLVPIDCSFYLILEIVDYSITFDKENIYRNLKFACIILSNGLCILLYGIYLEIIELHFCELDRFLRRNIIKREIEDKKFILLEEINDDID